MLAVTVVPAIVFGAVLPMVGGLDRSNVPPRVIVPVLVIGPPVKVKPFTVPAVAIEVTVPVVGVAHDGTPDAKVNTWPLDPAAKNVVVLAADW